MKLSNLFENTDLRKVVPKHLVMYAGENDLVVISDVPRISEEQYEKLYKMSFKERLHYGVGDEVDFMPTLWDPLFRENEEKWYKWVDSRGSMVIRTMKWNEFVEFIKENYPDEADDFNE